MPGPRLHSFRARLAETEIETEKTRTGILGGMGGEKKEVNSRRT